MEKIAVVKRKRKGKYVECKKCKKCEKIKPLTDFHKNSGGVGGRVAKCKMCRSMDTSLYYILHREDIRLSQKEQYNRNKIYYEVKNKQYYQDNKKIIIKRVMKYEMRNPKYKKLRKTRRDTKEKYLTRNITPNDVLKIERNFNNKCSLTGKSRSIHNDHFIPISIGHGGTYLGNIIPLHKELNLSKSNKNPFEWIKTRNDIDMHKFNKVVEYLADLNGLSSLEYKDFVYWCFDNPRTIEQIKADNDKTSLKMWKESKLKFRGFQYVR